MLKSMIRQERDLRRLMRESELGKRIRWVEPAMGSTLGLPDCFLQWGAPGMPTVLWLELKLGRVAPQRPDVMLFHIRPDQKATISQMRYEGMKVGLIVAEQHSRRVYGVNGGAAVHGSFVIGQAHEARISGEGEILWREMFNFLFFDEMKLMGG